ncbi:MAG: hypothetical protein JRI97_06405, partial [Deltaproteobacteria bacterium]|nr:hypothetical protein [Deltaproteobacteria bacterium]
MNGGLNRVGVFAPAGDPEARAVRAALGDLGAACLFLDTEAIPPVAWDGRAVRMGGEDLASLDVVWVRGFSGGVPVAPAPALCRDFTLWQADWPLAVQRQGFFLSLFTELSRRGVEVVNTPETLESAFCLPLLLERVRGAGLFVPPMLVTNREEHARAFLGGAKHGCAWRPATGRAPWQRVSEPQIKHLFAPGAPPVWLAHVRPGPHLRAWLYKGRPLAVLGYKPAHPGPPERLEILYEETSHGLEEEFSRLYRA